MPPDYKGGGVVRHMTGTDGYEMVRRPGCLPFVVSFKDWAHWTKCAADGTPLTHKEPNQ